MATTAPPRVRGLPPELQRSAATRCLVMGVVNVTPDSFSDGGRWLDPEAAVRHGLELVADGADLVDVGGESTRPGAQRPSADEELRRVLPVVRALAGEGVAVSIDTMRAAGRRGGARGRRRGGQRRERRARRPGDGRGGRRVAVRRSW